MKRIIITAIIAIVSSVVTSAMAQSTVTFDNQSGEPALVKLIGPTSKEIEVPNATKRSVEASAGLYTIKVRYGRLGKYYYSKGDEFEVKETATMRSNIIITLHKVVAGNYGSRSITEKEFGETHCAPMTQNATDSSAKSGASVVRTIPQATATDFYYNTLARLGSVKISGIAISFLSVDSSLDDGKAIVEMGRKAKKAKEAGIDTVGRLISWLPENRDCIPLTVFLKESLPKSDLLSRIPAKPLRERSDNLTKPAEWPSQPETVKVQWLDCNGVLFAIDEQGNCVAIRVEAPSGSSP